MDCTRAEPAFFDRVMNEVGTLEAVDGIGIVDTSGSLTPQAGVWLTKHIKKHDRQTN